MRYTLIINPVIQLNHGIQLSEDGLMLYASSAEAVYRWTYDPDTISVSNRQTLINNMTNDGHYTRTLLLSRKEPEMLVVSRGSAANIDQLSAYKNNGISQIRALNLSELSTNDDEETGGIEPFNHATSGRLLGWGLRNSVGMAEHPITGGIYSVENSADGIERGGINIKNDNPGEELNFHGYLSDPTSGNQGGHFGYPFCLALWDTTISASNNFTDLGDMQTGDQFAHDRGFQWLDPDSRPGTEATTESADPDLLDGDVDDARCARDFVPPRLTFKAHMAPLDIKFSPDGTLAYVTWHGSWNRVDPAGYKVSVFEFDAETGEPVAQPRDTENVLEDLIWNPNTVQDCPRNCFRPVALAVDEAYAARGGKRVFFTSDSTGEIYVLERDTPPPVEGGADEEGARDDDDSAAVRTGAGGWMVAGLTVLLAVVGGLL